MSTLIPKLGANGNIVRRVELDLQAQCSITSLNSCANGRRVARDQTKHLPRVKLSFALELTELDAMDHGDNELDQDQDEAVLNFDVDDAAIELAATGVGTIPTASVNMVPPNCCVQRKR
jgi:hypothetical protein